MRNFGQDYRADPDKNREGKLSLALYVKAEYFLWSTCNRSIFSEQIAGHNGHFFNSIAGR